MRKTHRWTPQDAEALYNTAHWGDGYFGVNEDGHLSVAPRRSAENIDLFTLTQSLQTQGVRLPVLVRFTDILSDRVQALTQAFDTVVQQSGYTGRYTPVYPIKVNQQRSVVEHILATGRVGLEAGSKPELMAVLGLAPAGATIVCNGYKDRGFIRLALIGRKLGHRVFIVVEKLSELSLVMNEAKALSVEPLIGLRVRLATLGAGKWQNTGGEKSKFGLSATQVLEAVEQLRNAGKLDALRMVHCHLGSQIANLRDIRGGMREVARFYAELRKLGAPLDCVDVGGGLGVDYEGTRSRSYCSMNYAMHDYARGVVETLAQVCRSENLPQPDIISESGRALTAHHAVLVVNVVDVEQTPLQSPTLPAADAPSILLELGQLLAATQQPELERLQDAGQAIAEAHSLYAQGEISLSERAQAEQLYFAICRQIQPMLDPQARAHREALDSLREKLADKYFCNFSVFQSVPDLWAIDQVFPIMPIHRLNEAPSIRVSLCDLTCDSDGRIDQYVDRDGLDSTLPAHPLRADEPYLLGFFLVGAYQEILGDMHNLFGDTDAVDIALDATGGWTMLHAEHGDRTDELLRYVHFEPEDLLAAYERKLAATTLSADDQQAYFAELKAGLMGYTYLI